jgi:hypothetical protein
VEPVYVVVAADVVVAALSRVSPQAVAFPSMPPKTADPYADVIGAFVNASGDFAWILSEAIIEQITLVLTDESIGLGWTLEAAEGAIDAICNIADSSDGGLVNADPTVQVPTVGDPAQVAMRTVASKDLGQPRVAVVVTNDLDAIAIEDWEPRGVPWPPDQKIKFLSPTQFRDLVERARWKLRPIEP